MRFDTLHELLERALECFECIERDERYVITWNIWHEYCDGVTYCCFAGAYMAGEYDWPRTERIHAKNVTQEGLILDRLARGEVEGHGYPVDVCLYDGPNGTWWHNMRDLLAWLKLRRL